MRQVELEMPNEVHVECPAVNWEYNYVVSLEDPFVVCPNLACRHQFWPKCREPKHNPRTWEEDRELRQKEDENEKLLAEYLKEAESKACPTCQIPIVKDRGCNFINCPSSKCKKKTYFCFLCGLPMERRHHYTHYKKGGPYGNSCNTLDGLETK